MTTNERRLNMNLDNKAWLSLFVYQKETQAPDLTSIRCFWQQRMNSHSDQCLETLGLILFGMRWAGARNR
jgi:hypothetical protein